MIEAAPANEAADARVRAARDTLRPIAAEFPFEPRFFEHPDGVAQHFIDEGPRAREALLFVHGNPTWSFAWRRAIARLRARQRCVAVDHVGCGLSDKPARYPYRLVRHVENLERLCASLDVERWTLVLHDWGGPIGLGFARRHADRVRRLVLMNTAGFPLQGFGKGVQPEHAPAVLPAHPPPPTHPGETNGAADGYRVPRLPWRLAACRLPLLGPLAVRGLNAFARGAVWMAVERPLAPAARRGYLLPYDSWKHRVATHAFVADIPLGPEHPSWTELVAIERALPAFADRPVHLLWGERDWVFTPRYREEWQRRFPHATVTAYPRAGHYLFEDEADAWLRDLEQRVSP